MTPPIFFVLWVYLYVGQSEPMVMGLYESEQRCVREKERLLEHDKKIGTGLNGGRIKAAFCLGTDSAKMFREKP